MLRIVEFVETEIQNTVTIMVLTNVFEGPLAERLQNLLTIRRLLVEADAPSQPFTLTPFISGLSVDEPLLADGTFQYPPTDLDGNSPNFFASVQDSEGLNIQISADTPEEFGIKLAEAVRNARQGEDDNGSPFTP